MAKQAELDRVWDIVEKIRICMMTTEFDGGLRARPLQAKPDREAGVIWFLIDVRGAKDDEIASMPDACLTFVDADNNVYLSISGRAEVHRDPSKAQDLWDGIQQAWWPGGPGDPNVRVMGFVPHLAEYWDGPASSLLVAFEFAKARVTGEPPNLGENRKVRVTID